MPSILLKNLTSVIVHPSFVESVDIRISNGKIVERGKTLQPKRGEEVYDLNGKIVMPGFVNAHTHLYSSLSRGMPMPKDSPQNILEILQKIWWKLDRALDEEAIYYSALVGAIDAIRYGTTTLVDHHASPKSIKGSLDIIKEAMEEVGLRGVLCYEVTDRGGKKERDLGLVENERFIRSNKKNSHFRGLVGAHASFTLSNESLRLCGELASKYKTGVHIHTAEDKCDVTDAEENYRSSVVDRLSQYHILKKESILAHCVHFTQKDFPRIHDAKCWMVHNPRSNMNNRVGYAPVHLLGERVAIGTDGFPADMFEEAKIGFFKRRDSGLQQSVDMNQLLHGGQRLVSEIFGKQFGTLAKGSVADLVVLDYSAPTPMTEKNIGGHFLFGMNSSMVESVMVGGKWVVKYRQVVCVDVQKVFEKASKVAKKLWGRMEKF
jgi:putative selenium metabolism protein SsnA